MRMRNLGLALTALLGLTASASAQDVLPITIGAATATDHAPVFVGVEKGIFAKHGLDAKVEMYQTGVEMINGLLNGAQDVNVMGSVPFLAGVSNGFPLLLIGHLHGDPNRDYYAQNVSIVAGPNAGIGDGEIDKLTGTTVGLPRGSGAEGYALGILSQAGLAQEDTTIVNVKPSELVTALQNGDVDAISIWEPWASTAVTKVPGSVRVIAGSCEQCYDPGTILTTKQVAEDKAETLRRFMVAFAEAQQWVRQDYDAAAEVNMRWIPGIDADTMKMAIRRSNYDHRMSDHTPGMYAAKTIPFLLSQDKLKGEFDPMIAIDPQFYLHAESTAPEYYSDLPPIPD
ncbi:MAG: ABC transporter substrate-binding protein, partial [Pseudomonadota bacterium]